MKSSTIEKECKKHGITLYVMEGRGYYRCKKCRTSYVVRKRRQLKELLIKDFGGKCVLCGYDRCVAALVFHHLDPTIKDFGISKDGFTFSYKRLKTEADKCILLCHNCHMEVHYKEQTTENYG